MTQRITARCYAGPIAGKWVTIDNSYAFIAPARWTKHWVWRDGDPEEEFKIVTYRVMWIKPPGWRIAFPAFVLDGTAAAHEIDAAYRTHDYWPIDANARYTPRLADPSWPVKKNEVLP